jgi:hypothetical protein
MQGRALLIKKNSGIWVIIRKTNKHSILLHERQEREKKKKFSLAVQQACYHHYYTVHNHIGITVRVG